MQHSHTSYLMEKFEMVRLLKTHVKNNDRLAIQLQKFYRSYQQYNLHFSSGIEESIYSFNDHVANLIEEINTKWEKRCLVIDQQREFFNAEDTRERLAVIAESEFIPYQATQELLTRSQEPNFSQQIRDVHRIASAAAINSTRLSLIGLEHKDPAFIYAQTKKRLAADRQKVHEWSSGLAFYWNTVELAPNANAKTTAYTGARALYRVDLKKVSMFSLRLYPNTPRHHSDVSLFFHMKQVAGLTYTGCWITLWNSSLRAINTSFLCSDI